jgi:hypothetical protein
MNTQLTRHERSDLFLGFGKNVPANTAMEPSHPQSVAARRIALEEQMTAAQQ